MSLRVKTIQYLLNVNENLIFYPRLKTFYRNAIKVNNPIIFDVGANKGQTIRFFLKLFPQAIIYAFEPNHKLFQKLTEQFGYLSNIKLINKGVSSQNGKLVLKETVTDETSTFEELNYNSNYLKMKSRLLGIKPQDVISDRYEVEVVTLSEFTSIHQLEYIHILKIDTEGHELKCLEGLFRETSPIVDYIQLEHHYDDMYLYAASNNAIELFLLQNGFSLNKRIKHGFGSFDELLFKSTRL